MKQFEIDNLIEMGKQLRVAFDAIDTAEEILLENDLENEFFDGILTEKLETLSNGVVETAKLIAELAANSTKQLAIEQASAIIAGGMQATRDLTSGATFGFTQPACDGNCEVPATEPSPE